MCVSLWFRFSAPRHPNLSLSLSLVDSDCGRKGEKSALGLFPAELWISESLNLWIWSSGDGLYLALRTLTNDCECCWLLGGLVASKSNVLRVRKSNSGAQSACPGSILRANPNQKPKPRGWKWNYLLQQCSVLPGPWPVECASRKKAAAGARNEVRNPKGGIRRTGSASEPNELALTSVGIVISFWNSARNFRWWISPCSTCKDSIPISLFYMLIFPFCMTSFAKYTFMWHVFSLNCYTWLNF